MSASVHKIGTYNMSFMNDLITAIGPETAFASEGVFLARLQSKPDERRSYWLNALNMLKDFLEREKPSVIGLQEMNLTEPGSKTGTDAINTMLTGTPYKQISKSVETNNAGLSIIYNPDKIGELKQVQCIDNVNQSGRPLLMILTEKDGKKYLSVTMHGAQEKKNSNDINAINKYMLENNKKFLETSVKTFLESNAITLETLTCFFVTGDFNDRYNAITEVMIGDKAAVYTGNPPKSCCHNWASSCPDDLVEYDFGNGYNRCKQPAKEEMVDQDGSKLPLSPPERGAIKNYKYAGDKVFGFNPVSDMAIYRPEKEGWDGISRESDHELVYASFSEGAAGGRRFARKNRTKKRRYKLRSSKSKRIRNRT